MTRIRGTRLVARGAFSSFIARIPAYRLVKGVIHSLPLLCVEAEEIAREPDAKSSLKREVYQAIRCVILQLCPAVRSMATTEKSVPMRLALFICLVICSSANAQQFSILSWNIEGSSSDPAVIKKQLGEFIEPFDILALMEVAPGQIESLGAQFQGSSYAGGTTSDLRLLIAWDETKFESTRVGELREYNGVVIGEGGQRAPLIVTLRIKESGQEFHLIDNHLARGNEKKRNQQTTALVEWARNQTLPVIAVGDFNMDYEFRSQRGNEAFSIMQRDGVYKWVKPFPLIDTNWYDQDRDGKDDFPESILDYTFVAGPAKDWNISTHVIVRANDFPDDKATSDHRPVLTKVLITK